nr:helix-turn-helix domain-containing protein [Clostridium beijerinckii]
MNTHLTMNEKLFLVEIDSLDNEKGCFASNDYFAEFFCLSKNRCSEIIKSLEKKGFLSVSYKYKAGTKAIESRIIKLLEISIGGTRNIDCGVRNIDRGTRDIDRGYSENCEDNNTILNNTVNNINTISKDIVSSTKVQPIIDKWNELGLQKLISINKGTNRYKLLQARLKEYGQDEILQAIENIKCSSFLKGQNNKNWTVTFDWLVKPNNFIKILEGNYVDKENPVKIAKNKDVQPLRFNNFEPRKYDYDNLEKKLLGWDNDD